jgi:hypothetical protein
MEWHEELPLARSDDRISISINVAEPYGLALPVSSDFLGLISESRSHGRLRGPWRTQEAFEYHLEMTNFASSPQPMTDARWL